MWRLERSPAPADPSVESDLEWIVVEETGGLARVIIHNDDVTPFDFVIVILRAVFGLPLSDAERITAHAHFNGLAYVMTLPLEEAKHRVGRAHSIARQAGYPLSFTIEPESSRQ